MRTHYRHVSTRGFLKIIKQTKDFLSPPLLPLSETGPGKTHHEPYLFNFREIEKKEIRGSKQQRKQPYLTPPCRRRTMYRSRSARSASFHDPETRLAESEKIEGAGGWDALEWTKIEVIHSSFSFPRP